MRLLPAAALAVSLLVPGAASAAPARTTATVAYRASAEVIANPGRGFFTYTETHLRPDGTGWEPLDADDLIAARRTDGRSLVFRIIYLEKYVDADIGAADLALIRADFATARRAGAGLVLRFAYTSQNSADASADRVVRHLGQLGPILKANADVLTAVQAGLVGQWGEWYYSDHFASDTDNPGNLSAADWAARRRVLTGLLANTAPATIVQVRTPLIKRTLAPAVARVGVHNDCFLAGDDDYGTFTGDDRAWLARQSATMLVGGETCDPSARSGWTHAAKELAAYHWTYLNPSFNSDVLDSWGTAGRTEAAKRLGYRLRLTSATLPVTARRGATVTARITLTNDGYAAPVASRPVRLLLVSGTRVRSVPVAADVRTWQPGRTVTLTVTFPAPAVAGSYALALALPDASASLQADPAYAVRFANDGTWNPLTGRNALRAALSVR